MVEVYVSDSSGEYFQVGVLGLKHTRYRDFDTGEELEFTVEASAPVTEGCWVRVEEHGGVIYRGAVATRTGSLFYDAADHMLKGKLKIKCISIPQIFKSLKPWSLRYGAPPVVEGYSAMTIGEVLSFDPPQQTAGAARYVPGLGWMAHSWYPVTPDSRVDGVWYYAGLGIDPRFAGRDIYVGGHKCTEVSDLTDLATSEYQFYRGRDLHIWGDGEADFGPVFIDRYADTGLRFGNLDRSGDLQLTALDLNIGDNIWQTMEDYLFAMGIYLRLRHSGNYSYLDGSINPYGRGSSTSGAFQLHIGDFSDLKLNAPRDIPPSIVIGYGAGENVTRRTYSLLNPSHRGPIIEQVIEVGEGELAPLGRMEDIVDAEALELFANRYFSLNTNIAYMNPGDYADVEIAPGQFITSQISEIGRDLSPIREIKFGGKYAEPKYAYLEKQASLAVEAMQAGQLTGSYVDTDNLGPSTTASISWTPIAVSDRDTAKVTVDLAASVPDDSTESSLAVTYILTIYNTLYPSGQEIARIPLQAWGADPVFESLPITEWCALDGTEETLEIDVEDPSGNLSETLAYTITINGVGRYYQSAIKTLGISGSAISSTLDGDIWVEQWDYEGGSTTGEAYYNLANVAAPSFDFKLVLVHTARLVGNTSKTGWSRPYIKTHSTNYYGAKRYPGTSYQQYEDDFTTNPHTGAAWTQSELDDLQIGIILNVEPDYVPGMYRNYLDSCSCGSLRAELR